MDEIQAPRGLTRADSLEPGVQLTPQDYTRIKAAGATFKAQLPGRVLTHMRQLDTESTGLPVGRLEHCLQTATRAYRAGRDDEYVLCALVHDIGDTLGSYNHANIASAILRPFVSERNHWMVDNHDVFQGYYYFHHIGLDRNARDRFVGHQYFEYTSEFCREFDQPAFDPSYDTLSLEDFAPLVWDLMTTPKTNVHLARQAPVPRPS
jgi:predicted HD phosphohydrolase